MFFTANILWIGPTLKLTSQKRRFIESYFINLIPNTMNNLQNDKFPRILSATVLQTP